MLKPIKFDIVITDGGESVPLSVTASGTDYSAYEEKFRRSSYFDLIGYHYRAWMFVVWHALTRTGQTELTYDEFEALTPDVDYETNGNADSPLGQTPPSGTSPD